VRVFITGASSGLGAALARHYAGQGAILGLTGRDARRLAAVATALGTTAPHAVYIADVADAAAMRAAAGDFIARHGVPDVVIANAGISVGTDPADADDLAVLDRTLRTNVSGLAATFQPFIEAMSQRGSGTLVGIASMAGLRGLPGSAAYSASNAAAIAWLESARVTLHARGIRVVTICPGFIDTPMTRVNRYPMPFRLSADEAARRIARAIRARKRFATVPWQMALVGALLRRLPPALYDRLLRRAPHKPRKLPT
jgi:short-subunit dehydrogenase